MPRTIAVSSVLPAEADRVWEAMKHPASFLYVCRGLLGLPALAGRTSAVVEGEVGDSMLMLFQVEPLADGTSRYSDTVDVDAGRLTGAVAFFGTLLYRYRQRRWKRLALRHLQPRVTDFGSC
jgi:hypothetical protein